MAGATFVVLGLAFAIGGARYDVGSALRMGSGYVPLVLGSILTLLGVVIVAASFRGVDPDGRANADRGPIPWQRMGLIVGAILFFGVHRERAGPGSQPAGDDLPGGPGRARRHVPAGPRSSRSA